MVGFLYFSMLFMIIFALTFEGDNSFYYANSLVDGENCTNHTRDSDNSFCSEVYFNQCISYKSDIVAGIETYEEGKS